MSLVRGGYVTAAELQARFAQIEPGLLRYPAIDPPEFVLSIIVPLARLRGVCHC